MITEDMAHEPAMTSTTQRKALAILRALEQAGRPTGAADLAERVQAAGTNLRERAVRLYLKRLDALGLTENLGRRGRQITNRGRRELSNALVVEKVGFISAKMDVLCCKMSFNLGRGTGTIILNVSTLAMNDVPAAAEQMLPAFQAGLGMGRFLKLGTPGAQIGGYTVPTGKVAIGTVCGVSVSGVLCAAGIPARCRFGGLLEIENGRPLRFTQIIGYEATTLDPLEIFIKGRMTSVAEAARTGSGTIGASFREVPDVAIGQVRAISKRLERIGLGGIPVIGTPGRPLLDIPVGEGRAGLVVAGGLNPLAAVEEAGIRTENAAMSQLYEFENLVPYEVLHQRTELLAGD